MTTTDAVFPEPVVDGSGSRTLDRGLRLLALVCASPSPLSIAEIATSSGLHRSICYRLVRTLAHHDLLERDPDGRYRAGGGLAVLAGRLEPRLQSAARTHLEQLAESTGMTAFVVTAHGADAVTVLVVEPQTSLAHVSYRPGGRHRLDVGAPGLAILAGRPRAAGERRAVTEARAQGWATSVGEVIPGYHSVSAPVLESGGECRHAVAVVYAGEGSPAVLGPELVDAAHCIAADLA